MMVVIGTIMAIKMPTIVVTVEVDNSPYFIFNNRLRHFVMLIVGRILFNYSRVTLYYCLRTDLLLNEANQEGKQQ